MSLSLEDIMDAIKQGTQENRSLVEKFDKLQTTINDLYVEIRNFKVKTFEQDKIIKRQQAEIEFLKKEAKKNNVIIYGVPEEKDEHVVDTLNVVKKVCNEVAFDLPDLVINNCYRIGRGKNPRPICLSLTSNKFMSDLWKKRTEFNRNKIQIAPDRTREEREYRRKLYQCLQSLKKYEPTCIISRNYIKLKGQNYSLEEAERLISECYPETSKSSKEDNQSSKKVKRETLKKLDNFRFHQRTGSTNSI
uniref:Endonuclease-reverse transcriptase n=2 Tax=Rhodnius prolixus TaxID=13249 RepID=T1HSB2_RHOPR